MKNTDRNIDKVYEDHIGLIKSRVNKFSKKYKYSDSVYEELYLEANLLFTELFYKHDINKGKFSTLLVTSLDNYLKNVAKKNIAIVNKEVDMGNLFEIMFDTPQNNMRHTNNHANNIIEKISLQQKIDTLSIKDKEVVEVALSIKDTKYVKCCNVTKHAIKRYLIDLGWRAVDIQRSFNRIELVLFGQVA